MFTSGSTGEPKGVPITYGCLQSFLRWILAEHAFLEGREVFLNVVPYSFDVSLMDTYPALVTGGTVTSVTKAEVANPRQLYQLLATSALTTWVSTPSFAQMCLVEPTFNQGMLPRLERFLFCGETLAPEVASQLLDRFPAAEVWNTVRPHGGDCRHHVDPNHPQNPRPVLPAADRLPDARRPRRGNGRATARAAGG